ncbi:MAG: hypothetical protein QXD51_03665 [Candidatus Anstonellales archaeon]
MAGILSAHKVEKVPAVEIEIFAFQQAQRPKKEEKKQESFPKIFFNYFMEFFKNPFNPLNQYAIRDNLKEMAKPANKAEFFNYFALSAEMEEKKKKWEREELERARKIAEYYFEKKGFEEGGRELVAKAESMGNYLETLSYEVESIPPENLLEIARLIESNDKKGLEKALSEIGKEHPAFVDAINFIMSEKEARFFLKKAFPINKKGFAKIFGVKGKTHLIRLLRAYAKVLSDEKYLMLLKAIGRAKLRELRVFASSLDPILRYIFLRRVLPALYACGMVSINLSDILKQIMKESMGGRIKANPVLLRIFAKLPKFLFFFGQPDGKTLELFLEGRAWKR